MLRELSVQESEAVSGGEGGLVPVEFRRPRQIDPGFGNGRPPLKIAPPTMVPKSPMDGPSTGFADEPPLAAG